jgi:hypothetical protein
MSAMRGRFQSLAHGVSGTGGARPSSRARRVTSNVITVGLLLVAVWLLLRRFGVLRH